MRQAQPNERTGHRARGGRARCETVVPGSSAAKNRVHIRTWRHTGEHAPIAARRRAAGATRASMCTAHSDPLLGPNGAACRPNQPCLPAATPKSIVAPGAMGSRRPLAFFPAGEMPKARVRRCVSRENASRRTVDRSRFTPNAGVHREPRAVRDRRARDVPERHLSEATVFNVSEGTDWAAHRVRRGGVGGVVAKTGCSDEVCRTGRPRSGQAFRGSWVGQAPPSFTT